MNQNQEIKINSVQAALVSVVIGIVGFGACCLFLSWALVAPDTTAAVPWFLASVFAGVVTGFALALIDKDQATNRSERQLEAEGKYDEATGRASVNHGHAALLAPPSTRPAPANYMAPKPMVINGPRGRTNRDAFGVGQSAAAAPAGGQPQWRPLLPSADGYESLPNESVPEQVADDEPVLVEPKWMTRERKAMAKSEAWANAQDRIAELAMLIFARVRYYDPTTANVLALLGPAGPGRLITGTGDITSAMQILAARTGEGGWQLAAKRGTGPTSAWRWVNQTTGECDELGDKSPSPAAALQR